MVFVGVKVLVGVNVLVGVIVGVNVLVGVRVLVGVKVGVDIGVVCVTVGVGVGVKVGVGVGGEHGSPGSPVHVPFVVYPIVNGKIGVHGNVVEVYCVLLFQNETLSITPL